MKLHADRTACEANAVCAQVDWDLFHLDQDGYIDIGAGVTVPAGKEENARLGVSVCPLQALRLSP